VFDQNDTRTFFSSSTLDSQQKICNLEILSTGMHSHITYTYGYVDYSLCIHQGDYQLIECVNVSIDTLNILRVRKSIRAENYAHSSDLHNSQLFLSAIVTHLFSTVSPLFEHTWMY